MAAVMSRTSTMSTNDFGEARLDESLLSPLQRRISHLLTSPFVENGMALVIMANFVLIIVETDARAKDDGAGVVPAWISSAGWLVLALFIVELAGRLFAERQFFFRDAWNWFDFSIITIDLTFSLVAVLFEALFPVSLLRILRLAKVARVSKVFRLFPELRIMLAGLLGSFRAIMWGTVLLAIALLLVAVVAVQFIHPLNQELARNGVYEDCERCGEAFASTGASVLTFVQQILAGDNWGMVTIPLIEHYPVTAAYFVGVFLLIGMAVHNLILGVVVDVAQEARKGLAKELEKKRNIVRREGKTNLLQICRDMDTDNSCYLTKEELFTGYDEHAGFREALQGLDIQKEDLDVLWICMDSDRSGQVNYTEFVTELYNMRSSDSTFMLAYIKYYITVIKDKIIDEMKVVEGEDGVILDILKEMDKKMDGVEKASGRLAGASAGDGSKEAKKQDGLPELLTNASDNPQLLQKENDLRMGGNEPFAVLMDEVRQSQAKLMGRLEAMETKFESTLVDTLPTRRGMESWSLPWQCQTVSGGQVDRSVLDSRGSRQSPITSAPPSRGGAELAIGAGDRQGPPLVSYPGGDGSR